MPDSKASTERDATILRLIRWGWAYPEIAQALGISVSTVQRVALGGVKQKRQTEPEPLTACP